MVNLKYSSDVLEIESSTILNLKDKIFVLISFSSQ